MAPVSGSTSKPVSTPKPEPKVEAKPAPKAEPKAESPAAKNEVHAKPPKDTFESKPAASSAKPAEKTAKAEQKPVGPPSERATKNFNSDTKKEINKLANSPKAEVTTNKDGSETRTKSSTHGGVERQSQLTEKKGLLRDEQTKYTESTTRTKQNGNVDKETYTAQSKSDMFGRTTSSTSRETSKTRGAIDSANGQTTNTKNRTTATDQFDIKKTTESKTNTVTQGADDKHNTAKTTTSSTTTDSRGNKKTTTETKTATKDDNVTRTTGTKSSEGSELTTKSTAEFKNGKYTVGEQADWTNKKSVEASKSKETQLSPSAADKGFTQQNKSSKLDKAQQAGDLAAAAGAKTTIAKGEIPKDKMVEDNWVKGDPNTFVGTRNGTAGKYEVTAGADGIKATGNIEAKKGFYAETKTNDIPKGEAGAQGSANFKAEIGASAKGDATLNANGLDASGSAKIGATVEAGVTGKAQTGSVNVAGVDLNASAEGSAKVSATVGAEATGKVKVTRNPPTAIAEGSVGASAVAKAEAEAKLSAGPFSVKANGYVSAGAEATAKGSIGYEDGKIKISGSLGAALGVGAGGGASVEVDVKQIGEMAKNTAVKVADADGDGKLSLNDAKTVANNVVDTAKNTVNAAANKVKNFFGW